MTYRTYMEICTCSKWPNGVTFCSSWSNRAFMHSRSLTCVMILLGWGVLHAQVWPDKNAATPDLVQTDFGPNGSALPFDGSSYCGPTSAAMAIGYLNAAGFTQLLEPSPDYLNLVKVLSGLAGTSDSGGSYSSGVLDGVSTYFLAKGIGPGAQTITSSNDGNHRTIAEIAAENVEQNILIGLIGWYSEDGGVYTRDGGHFVVITGQSEGATDTLTVHNPFPNALLDVSNIPANVEQTVAVVDFVATPSNTSPSLGNATYLQFDTPVVGPTIATQGILEQVFKIRLDASQLPSNGFTPADWAITSATTLNTGGGDLTVAARVTGAGGIIKSDEGRLIFSNEVALTGDHEIKAGAIVAEAIAGDAFGTGSIALSGTGQLHVHPDDSSPAPVALALASRADTVSDPGAVVSFSGSNVISLRRGANPTLTVTLGGNSGNGQANLTQLGSAPTLIIDATDLGGSEKLLVRGTGGNLPAVTNGTVGGNIVGVNGQNGHFLTYDAADGLRNATTVSGDINAAGATDLYRATGNQTITASASVYALMIENVEVSGNGTLSVGGGAAYAGLLFNGGTLSAQTLALGSSQAAIFTSAAGGTIDSSITGTGGLVKFGPGDLTLGSASAGLSGTAYVNSGSLILDAAGAVGSSDISVRTGAKLHVLAAGSVTGNVTASASSQIQLDGGTLAAVEVQSNTGPSGPVQGATLSGHGTVTGDVSLNGYIASDPNFGAGTLTFDGLITTGAGAAFIWSLGSLVDNSDGTAGTDWNSLVLTNPDATFGSAINTVSLFFDFQSGFDPNSGNAFWDADHQWTLFTYSGRASAESRTFMEFPSQSFPAGNFWYEHVDNTTVLNYSAVPEPATAGLVLAAALGVILRLRLRARSRPLRRDLAAR